MVIRLQFYGGLLVGIDWTSDFTTLRIVLPLYMITFTMLDDYNKEKKDEM